MASERNPLLRPAVYVRERSGQLRHGDVCGIPGSPARRPNVFPLPWNTVYQAAWDAFLMQLNARYGSNPAFVSIAIAGPVGASDEMIFPTSANTTAAQPSGLAVDATWAALIQHSFPSNSAYQNTDQVFIDAWKQAIDAYESIFSGVTLFIGADAGDDFPNFSQTVTPHADNTLFAVDCSNSPKTEIMSCEAKTEILSYFVTVTGLNGKGTQVGGMTASSAVTIGNIGVQGVKVLTALSPPPSPPFIGGAEFDFPVSGSDLEGEGCPDPSGNCPGLSVVEGAYNVMTVFFTGTPAAAFYGGTVGTAPIQYLEVSYVDLQYALANACPATPSPTLGYMSLQDLYARASRDIFAMANQTMTLPAPTCSKTAPAPAITLVANAEGESPTIAPEHVGRDQGIESGGARRFAHLARIGLCGQFDANQVGQRQRHGKWQAGLCVLHQPFAGEHPDSARCSLGSGPGGSDLQRSNQRRLHRSGAIDLAFIFRLQRRTIRSRNPLEWEFDRAGHAVSGREHSRQAWRDHRALRQRIWTRPTYPCKADP